MLMCIAHSFGKSTMKCHGVCTLWHYFSICFSGASSSLDNTTTSHAWYFWAFIYRGGGEIPLKMQKLWKKKNQQNYCCRFNFGSLLHSLRNKEMQQHCQLFTALRSWKSKETTGKYSITCLWITAPHCTVGFYSVQGNRVWNLSDSLFYPFLRPNVITQVCVRFVQVCRHCIWGGMKRGRIYPSCTLSTKCLFCSHYIFKYCRTRKRSVLGYQCLLWDTITLKNRISHIKKAIQKYIWTFIFLTLEDFF